MKPSKAEPESELQGEANAASTAESGEMSARQLAEAKEYGRRELYCGLVDRFIDVAYLSLFAFFIAQPLDDWLRQAAFLRPFWLRLGTMFVIMTLGHILVSFPLSFYSGHVLEHRYGLSRQTVGRWFGHYAKRNLLTLAFGLALTQGLFWTIWLTGPLWWLAAAAAFFVVSAVLGQLAAGVDSATVLQDQTA